jgi:23S rRNA pseudouridine2605 synthase
MPPKRGKPARQSASLSESQGDRLQKVLAAAGIASRRECEELITMGRVEVDRKVVTELGTRVDPHKQEIRVDGTPLPQSRRIYFLVNKPPGIVSTNRDPEGRLRVIDLVPDNVRLFTVGRLDRGSEGLMLVTNDGELANRMTHPRYGIAKTYRVRVAGHPTAEQLQELRRGVHLAEGVARVTSLQVKGRQRQSTDLEIVLNEGRNREIRRVLARIGHKVMQLRRIAMGPLRLGDLPSGAFRQLTTAEVRQLRGLVQKHPAKTGGRSHRSKHAATSRRKTSSPSARATTAKGKPARTPTRKAKKKTGSTGTIIGAGEQKKRTSSKGASKKQTRTKGRPRK